MALKEKIEKNRQEKHDEKYMKMALKEAKRHTISTKYRLAA